MMTLPEQQRPQARQAKEKGVRRSSEKSKSAALVLALDRAQIPQQLALLEELELDGRVGVGREVLGDLGRDGRRVQERRARVPLDLGLGPFRHLVLVLLREVA